MVGIAENFTEAVKLVNQADPQLIFLDIQMPGGNGFDLVEHLKAKSKSFIFVTAYNQFVLQALRCNAVDYLLKPLNIHEVITAVKRVQDKIYDTNLAQRLDLLLNNVHEPEKKHKITVPTSNGYVFIDLSDIERLEAKGAYTEIFIVANKSFLVSKNIKEYEQLLPPDKFYRIHHSHIINVDFVKYYHKGRGGFIEMKNGITLEVSSRRRDDFLSSFK